MSDSNGAEVWRRISDMIFVRSEQRLLSRSATGHAFFYIPGVFEEWDTNRQLYMEIGGVPLRKGELGPLRSKWYLEFSETNSC